MEACDKKDMTPLWDILTILAFIVGLLGLFARYDLLIRKFIYHLYTPNLQLIFYPGSSNRPDGSVTTRTPDHYDEDNILSICFNDKNDEFCISREDLCYSEYIDDDTQFAISIENLGEKTFSIDAEFLADWRIQSTTETIPKPLREVDFGGQIEIQEVDLSEPLSVGPKRKFDFKEFILDSDAKRSFSFIINDERVNGDSMGDYEAILRISVSIDASEFNIWRWKLPNNIGSIEYGTVEQEVTICN
jgi:hypothetical protein